MTLRHLRLGTRGSALARRQCQAAEEALRRVDPRLTTELVPMRVPADDRLDRSIAEMGGKSVFVRGLEKALMDGAIDVAVHSAKDVETRLAPGLRLEAALEALDPADVLLTRAPEAQPLEATPLEATPLEATPLEVLPVGAVLGTASIRRQAQCLSQRPDLRCRLLRGNLPRRLHQLETGAYDAIILARAGLQRLGLTRGFSLPFSAFLPAACQGIVVLQVAASHPSLAALVELLARANHTKSFWRMTAERAALEVLDGTCTAPIGLHGAFAEFAEFAESEAPPPAGGRLRLRGMVLHPQGRFAFHHDRTHWVDSAEACQAFGAHFGEELKAKIPPAHRHLCSIGA